MTTFRMTTYQSPLLGLIQIPIARIRLSSPLGSFRTTFLIDSGADITVVSYNTGALLNWSQTSDDAVMFMRGITGQEPCILRQLTMRIGSTQLQARVAWAQSNLRVNVLGRLDVFDAFNIEFRQSEGRTVFRAVKR